MICLDTHNDCISWPSRRKSFRLCRCRCVPLPVLFPVWHSSGGGVSFVSVAKASLIGKDRRSRCRCTTLRGPISLRPCAWSWTKQPRWSCHMYAYTRYLPTSWLLRISNPCCFQKPFHEPSIWLGLHDRKTFFFLEPSGKLTGLVRNLKSTAKEDLSIGLGKSGFLCFKLCSVMTLSIVARALVDLLPLTSFNIIARLNLTLMVATILLPPVSWLIFHSQPSRSWAILGGTGIC